MVKLFLNKTFQTRQRKAHVKPINQEKPQNQMNNVVKDENIDVIKPEEVKKTNETKKKSPEKKKKSGKKTENKKIKKKDMLTEQQIELAEKQAETIANGEVKRVKKERGLIERTESSKIILTEDNRQVLND